MAAGYISYLPFHAKGAWLLLLSCGMAMPAAGAQQKQGESNGSYQSVRVESGTRRKARPLTRDEGLAILGAALDSRRRRDRPADCSHLVHALYERAGFHYEYASSSDLYAGVDEFRRVSAPQPGDLAVWPGHAGIVINPAQHSFFSLLSTGPGVDFYDSSYWKQRGRPHFFRYVKRASGGASSSASLRP
jgi:hypothetical protein